MASLAAAAFAASPPRLPEGEGKKTVETVCASCHGLEIVTDKKWSREDWQSAVNAMNDRGASLSKEQTASVVGYLAKNFGKDNDETARVLVEDVCSYCHELRRIKRQAMSKEEWRETIKGMVSEGAPVTDEEFTMIVDYLAKYYGKKEQQ